MDNQEKLKELVEFLGWAKNELESIRDKKPKEGKKLEDIIKGESNNPFDLTDLTARLVLDRVLEVYDEWMRGGGDPISPRFKTYAREQLL